MKRIDATGDVRQIGPLLDRREILKAGAGLVAAPILAGIPAGAQAESQTGATNTGPYRTRAYGTTSADRPIGPIEIVRRTLEAHDVLIDVLYCGICHSDIHTVHGHKSQEGSPVVPGHEIIGRVAAIGNAVTKFKVGDIAGVGCMVDSCRTCENCEADREQNCLNGTTFTYGSPDKRGTAPTTYGGYSERIVVTEHFGIRIPPGMDLAATAPLLCAAITTFSPMQHWRVEGGQRVGVIGLGGLGHMAVKLAVARKVDVTVFTTSPGKIADAKRLGAKEAVLSTDAEAMKRLANRFDLLISTVPVPYAMQPFIDLLKLDATLVNVGTLGEIPAGLSGIKMVIGRKSLAGSLIGGIAETQEVIDYCAARGIKADVEIIKPQDINRAYERVLNKDVRYRFVIDIASRGAAGA
ncbi:MAG: NAD(P)-dependent alcohol dehydrogenase [Armatimonadota bacterium]